MPGLLALAAIFGTGSAYLLNQRNIRSLGATTASTVTFLVPIVSIVSITLGLVVLREPFHVRHVIGALIIIAGVQLVKGRLRLPQRQQARVVQT